MSGERQRQTSGGNGESTPSGLLSPRVVIFESDEEPRVEVMDLGGNAQIGTLICHHGTSWQVIDLRTHNRVIICRPAEA